MFSKESRLNLANLVTYTNISLGLLAIYFITQGDFFLAIVFAWCAGGLDIVDGKVARKFNLSSEFGIQIDSFADFISFVITPVFLLFYVVEKANIYEEVFFGVVSIFYIISALVRLIEFNIKSEAGSVAKYFEGIPTPLGAIVIWIFYLLYAYSLVTNVFVLAFLLGMTGFLLNSKIKIPHP